MAHKAIDIAKKILAKASTPDSGELVSNLKLQKMLYYQQGFHLAVFNKPLFDDEIEAWMYGPAIPCVYDHYKRHGNSGIKYNGEILALSPEQESLFNEVFDVYGDYSAIGLMNMTHREAPWKTTPTGKGNVISHEKMKRFFKTRLK